MRTDTPLVDDWTFAPGFSPAAVGRRLEGAPVSLPHSAVELPFDYFDETAYQKPFTYQRVLAWEPRFEGRRVRLLFEGAMADAVVWVNGQEVARHRDGYTPFHAELTEHLRPGDNIVTVKVDGAENPEIPPFGGQIDYLTYAGLYRDVRLQVLPRLALGHVTITTPDALAGKKSVRIHAALDSAPAPARLTARLLDGEGGLIARAEAETEGGAARLDFDGLTGLRLWTLDDPALYSVELTLESAAGTDRVTERFGFRTAEFTATGFRLNGRPLKLIGLNRHQSFPHSGYAQGRHSQERDAEILKHELGCNMVRTSHYPQSKHFLNRCDELGLLVFEEIPGWQHIGGADWKAEAVENVRRMIERDRNHPSIVIWGVRINESQDDHDFYAETNRLARALDPTRQTGGVRFITDSEMLEDVYTMNDFILGDFEQPFSNRPRTALRAQRETTGLKRDVPYLVTEYNGHMFPTKAGDPELRQVEHVTRHLDVLDAMYGDPAISGCIGWCMFDYNTHKDFGAGDRICHHGVMTMFRDKKFAADAYASQRDPAAGVVMTPVTVWARGERNIGGVLPLTVLTNCDEIEVRLGADKVKRIGPARSRYPHLPHPPVILDHRDFSRQELGSWGMAWEDVEFVGYVGGQEVARRRFVADPVPTTLEVRPDLAAARVRDEVRVMIRAKDQAGNVLPFLADAVTLDVSGPGALIGPAQRVLRGGTTGAWVRLTAPGTVTLSVASGRFAPVEVSISVTEEQP
ncbi:probable beta-galactosidase protein [Oceanicola granulosus HTCC2516]|uniref:Probable beta-galactosidase protein n=1 Tax=Oceanicola granulosus (strain ATCC BAA-861 / DSM 15982 / KCTC 12143 / HTCC2516) TaxID=314256 RepID=Q2CBV9_OCEGH|nr:glycoside hydrolase family 2 TIM barrel-domain containing protein [Oceanicola granulosus]EAR50161.1 probable beta-galactosidase protein [Oceanicola granulosus HTCC2516]